MELRILRRRRGGSEERSVAVVQGRGGGGRGQCEEEMWYPDIRHDLGNTTPTPLTGLMWYSCIL